jgi:hypothetical protein
MSSDFLITRINREFHAENEYSVTIFFKIPATSQVAVEFLHNIASSGHSGLPWQTLSRLAARFTNDLEMCFYLKVL